MASSVSGRCAGSGMMRPPSRVDRPGRGRRSDLRGLNTWISRGLTLVILVLLGPVQITWAQGNNIGPRNTPTPSIGRLNC